LAIGTKSTTIRISRIRLSHLKTVTTTNNGASTPA
jgi:hypothetical protein